MILICLPFFVTAIAAVIVVVASVAKVDTFAIVTVEFLVFALCQAICFIAVVSAVVVTIAAPCDAD